MQRGRQRLASPGIPEARCVVAAASGYPPAIRTEGEAPNSVVVLQRRRQCLSGTSVKKVGDNCCRIKITKGHPQHLSIRAERGEGSVYRKFHRRTGVPARGRMHNMSIPARQHRGARLGGAESQVANLARVKPPFP